MLSVPFPVREARFAAGNHYGGSAALCPAVPLFPARRYPRCDVVTAAPVNLVDLRRLPGAGRVSRIRSGKKEPGTAP
jgi:hypothetical protein